MKLYFASGSCSQASHIVLHESGLPFETEKLIPSTMKTESGVDFVEINPKGYVPTLKMDDGNILTEGAVILQYIADQNPGSGLAPKAGTLERYRLQEWLNYIATEIHKAYSPLFNKAFPDEVKTSFRNQLTRRLGLVETQLSKTQYLIGNTFTVCDAYLFVVLGWSSRVGFDLNQFPKITEYISRIKTRPSVIAALRAEGLTQ
jgi:glutathione S-transferase